MSQPASPTSLFGRPVRSLHCLGVGGMGLGPLAIYLAGLGIVVTGQDDRAAPEMLVQLARAGVQVTVSGELPAQCDLVVVSSAIGASHPMIRAARARGFPVVRRGEVLAEVTRDLRLVAVCGSHGKTTTTALLIAALRAAEFPAGYVLGGLFADETLAPAWVGTNGWVVAEIDESDGTIARFSPALTVVVNFDWDHPDHYRHPRDLEVAFRSLAERTRGPVLISEHCDDSFRVFEGLAPLRFGSSGEFSGERAGETADCTLLSLGGRFRKCAATVRVKGDFNVANTLAALAAAELMGANPVEGALADFPGVWRRQSVLWADDALTVLEDYAHHPAEIRALIGSLRRQVQERTPAGADAGRIVVAFQPHRFSRTAQFKAEFATALALADSLHLLDTYGAGESPMPGGTSAELEGAVRQIAPLLPVHYRPDDRAGFRSGLHRGSRRGDLIAFVGAGDIGEEARLWVEEMQRLLEQERRWDGLARMLQAVVSAETMLTREESLAEKTTMRVGGAARVYAEPANIEDLQAIVRHVVKEAVPVVMLGRGSNVLIPDKGVDAVVISLSHASWQTFEPRPDGRVWVGAGLRLKNLCGLAIKSGLAGFEFLEGIPGNVGGALRMNAGAMGGWMFDVVEEVRLMTRTGEICTLRKSEMHVDYRHCAELTEAVALGALLKPSRANPADDQVIKRQIDTYRDKRHQTQPREPSAGCIFKNPPGNSAGRLIDQAGLKGERIGGAEVSTVHANFIVNRGGASCADVIALVRRIRVRVQESSGVTLEPEVLLYGSEWVREL